MTTSDQNVFGGELPTPAVVRQNSYRQDKWHKIGRDGRPERASKPQQRMRHKIQGNAQSDVIRGAPPPKGDYFVSQVYKETGDEGMKTCITDKGLLDFDLTLVSNINATFKSYKLSVSISDRDRILCSEMWLAGICFQRWRDRSSGLATGDDTISTSITQHGQQYTG